MQYIFSTFEPVNDYITTCAFCVAWFAVRYLTKQEHFNSR